MKPSETIGIADREFNEWMDNLPVCGGCGMPCDPDTCWCGVEKEQHDSWTEGHEFIPMGCECGFVRYDAVE